MKKKVQAVKYMEKGLMDYEEEKKNLFTNLS
jgi:hypothetical protein